MDTLEDVIASIRFEAEELASEYKHVSELLGHSGYAICGWSIEYASPRLFTRVTFGGEDENGQSAAGDDALIALRILLPAGWTAHWTGDSYYRPETNETIADVYVVREPE